ncbi:hypothetical protein VZT92_005603 [Zoarces viviparus]|uniref:Uncharacterized protein n=1 Tax=Zoarces viviparus TaxID=48416 RepID=A0AAW1FT86_ZOAVI
MVAVSRGSSFCRFFVDNYPCVTWGRHTVHLPGTARPGGSLATGEQREVPSPCVPPDNSTAQENNNTVSVSAGKYRQSERGNNSSTTGHTAAEDNLPSKMLVVAYQNSFEVAHFKRLSCGSRTESFFPAILVAWFWGCYK